MAEENGLPGSNAMNLRCESWVENGVKTLRYKLRHIKISTI